MLLMDFSISSKRNVSAFQATFFEMLSAWSASFLAGMTRISREMNHRACRERRRSLLPTMRLRLLPSHSFRHSRFTLANRITSLLPTNREISGQLSCCPSSAQNPEGVDRWSGAPRSRDPARARHPCTTAHKRITGHEWRVALELIAQSSSCMRRKLFLYSALPMAFPRRSPAT